MSEAVCRQAGAFGQRMLPWVPRTFYAPTDYSAQPATFSFQGSSPLYRKGGRRGPVPWLKPGASTAAPGFG